MTNQPKTTPIVIPDNMDPQEYLDWLKQTQLSPLLAYEQGKVI